MIQSTMYQQYSTKFTSEFKMLNSRLAAGRESILEIKIYPVYIMQCKLKNRTFTTGRGLMNPCKGEEINGMSHMPSETMPLIMMQTVSLMNRVDRPKMANPRKGPRR